MKNSKLFIKLSCIIPVLLILCMVNLKAQNYLSGYYYLGAFEGHYYYISNCSATWDEANAAAIEMGGYLATLTSMEENVWVTEKVDVDAGNGYFFEMVWIGLRGENGIYEWANGETSGFDNWAPSEPVYADGAALIDYDNFNPERDWTTHPVNDGLYHIVEFPYQPNCNNNPNKAYVCHNGNTICVNVTALQGHLDHGDVQGPCGPCNTYAMQAFPDKTLATESHSLQAIKVTDSESKEELGVQSLPSSTEITVFPNPASEEIHVLLPGVNHEGTIRILSFTGREMQTIAVKGQQSATLDLSNYAAGCYLLDFQSAKDHYQKKVVKL